MGRHAGLLISVLGLIGCETVYQPLQMGTQEHAIRNGTREPAILALDEGQKLAIGWLHPTGAIGQNFCTGTLVAPRVVATARHCIDGNGGRAMSFGMGLLPRDPVGTFQVETIHVHPFLDAAILILRDDVLETLPDVRPIPFNRTNLDQSYVGIEVEAAGYGETYDRTRSGRYFAVVELASVTPSEVIVNGRGRQGLCFGDSGGPVMAMLDGQTPVVLGVESWGDPSCVGIDHLIRLDAIAPWINGVTNEVEREPDPECAELPEVGVCDGQLLRRCQNGRYIEKQCEPESERCRVVDEDTGFFGCAEYDPCAEVGSRGVCDGDTVVRCRFGELVYEDCGSVSEVCTEDPGGAFCGPIAKDMNMPTRDTVIAATNDADVVESGGGSTATDPPGADVDAKPDSGEGSSGTDDQDEALPVVGGFDVSDTPSGSASFVEGEKASESRVDSGGCNVSTTEEANNFSWTAFVMLALWRRRLTQRMRPQ